MSRFLFSCAYDGAPWLGWQSQVGGNTVQDCIESCFARILHEPLRIHAAGRTDAGVHALAQYFHADVPESSRMDAAAWQAALNAYLPASIRIMSVQLAPPDFHARFSATGKEYEYRIFCGSVLPPHLAGRAWHCRRKLHLPTLRRVLKLYVGEHDFRHFAVRRGNEPNPIPLNFFFRIIFSATLTCRGEMLTLRFCGSGFLYRMVRMLVGAAVQAAAGTISPSDIDVALRQSHGASPCFCAPPDGLYLLRVLYEPID